MPASNELLNGTQIRAEVSAGLMAWASTDPGTGVLPADRIITWSQFKSHIANNGGAQYASGQCVDYSTMNIYKIVIPAPTGLTGTDASFCNYVPEVPEPNYQVSLSWTNSDASLTTKIFENGGYTGIFAAAGATSITIATAIGANAYTVKHTDGTNDSLASNTANVTISTLTC